MSDLPQSSAFDQMEAMAALHGRTIRGTTYQGDLLSLEFEDGTEVVVKIKHGVPQNGGAPSLLAYLVT